MQIKELVEPPKARDTLHGGITEAFKLLYDAKSHKMKMRYIDVVSFYPTVQFYDKYPVGHYTKILNPEVYNPDWFGFVQYTVLPPRGLYLPVLPYKQKTKKVHKLMFGLCSTCMERMATKCTHFLKGSARLCLAARKERKTAKASCQKCVKIREQRYNHNVEERVLTGFWCRNELNKAIVKGYKIQKIYEVWHFEETSTELFKSYIWKFLKIKSESSEYCNKDDSDEVRKAKEEDYRRKARELGIELGEIRPHPVLRFIANICLNSLLGKFGQADKQTKNVYTADKTDMFNLLTNKEIEDLTITLINDRLIHATYTKQDIELKENFNTISI